MKLRWIAVVAFAIFALSAAVAVAQTEVDHYRGHKEGKFDGTASTNGNTGKDRIKGEVDGDHASGFVARSIRLNKSGKEQRPGELCASGRVEWSATS